MQLRYLVADFIVDIDFIHGIMTDFGIWITVRQVGGAILGTFSPSGCGQK